MMDICEGETTQRCFTFEVQDEADLLAEEIEALGRERALDDALELAERIVSMAGL